MVIGINAQNASAHVVEPIRSIDCTTLNADPKPSAGDQVAINPVFNSREWRTRGTEFLLIPEMNTSLVPDFNFIYKIAQQ